MSHRNDSFIFSSDLKDWMSSEEKRNERRKKYSEDHRRRKEKTGNDNTGYKTLSSMNDQLRA